jgi:signal transduction histidine kinase
LDVEDRGIGIPRENLPQLFTPFFRARNAAEHYAGGLGLGLVICREIVERHGGSIQVTSDGPGQGSCFTVRLLRAAVATRPDALQRQSGPALSGRGRPPRLTTMRSG